MDYQTTVDKIAELIINARSGQNIQKKFDAHILSLGKYMLGFERRFLIDILTNFDEEYELTNTEFQRLGRAIRKCKYLKERYRPIDHADSQWRHFNYEVVRVVPRSPQIYFIMPDVTG